MKLLDKIAEMAGFVKKSWLSAWLQTREFNLLTSKAKVTAPYAQHSDVYKAIKAIGDNVGQADFKFFKNDKEVPNKQLEDLFKSPNPLLSRSQLWEATCIYLSLYGNAYWVFSSSVGQLAGTGRKLPAEIWAFNPMYFTPKRDSQGNLLGWMYRGIEFFQPEDVIHFKFFNPYDPILGLAPYDPISKTVELDYQSLIYNSKFFENDARPGFTLSTDQTLSDEQFKRLKQQWETEHKGVSQAHKIAILEGGLKPANVSETHKDMEFIEQRKLNREDIMGIWRVPKCLFSITDDVNYAIFHGQKKMFWTETIIPILKHIEEKLASDFFPRYAPGIEGKFTYNNVTSLQEDMNEKIDRAVKLFGMGVPFNKINSLLEIGLEPIQGGDLGYLSYNMVPVGGPIRTDAFVSPAEQALDPQRNQPPVKDPKTPPPIVDEPIKSIKKMLDRKEINRRFVSLQDPLEKKFESVIKEYFYKQRAKVLAQINKASTGGMQIKVMAQISIDWTQENKDLIDTTGPLIKESVNQGAQFAVSMLGSALDMNLFNPIISSLINDRFSKITEINNTVKDQLQSELNDALKAGETTLQIADRVRSVYNFASNRAKVIARTETTGAFNSATFMGFKEAGVMRKQWTTSHDELVRESHQHIDGEIVGIDQVFTNGVDFPGVHGPASEIINCRCNAIPILEE